MPLRLLAVVFATTVAAALLAAPAQARPGDVSARSVIVGLKAPRSGDFTLATFRVQAEAPAGKKLPELGLTVQVPKRSRLPPRLTIVAGTARLEEPNQFLLVFAAANPKTRAEAEDVTRKLGLLIIDATNGRPVTVLKQSTAVDVLSGGETGLPAVFTPGGDRVDEVFGPPTKAEIEWLRKRDEAVKEITARVFLAGLVNAARAVFETRQPNAAFIRKYIDASYKGGTAPAPKPAPKPGAATVKAAPFLEWPAVERTNGKGCAAGRVTLETKTVTLDPPVIKNNRITPGERVELTWTKRVCAAGVVRFGLNGRLFGRGQPFPPGFLGEGISFGFTLGSAVDPDECLLNERENPAAGCVYKLTLRLQNVRDPVPG